MTPLDAEKDAEPCTACGHRATRVEDLDGVLVGWCDFDWQRWVVRPLRARRMAS